MTSDPRLKSKAQLQEERQSRKAQQTASRKKKGVRKINPKRKGKRFPERREPEYVEWFHVQGFPCVIDSPLCNPTIEAAHVLSRGAGGADLDNLVPLCFRHHRLQHMMGSKSFALEYGLNLKAIARRITNRFYREKGLR